MTRKRSTGLSRKRSRGAVFNIRVPSGGKRGRPAGNPEYRISIVEHNGAERKLKTKAATLAKAKEVARRELVWRMPMGAVITRKRK